MKVMIINKYIKISIGPKSVPCGSYSRNNRYIIRVGILCQFLVVATPEITGTLLE